MKRRLRLRLASSKIRIVMIPDSRPDSLDWLVGSWTTEATHPAMPGVVVAGTTVVEWLEGRRFLTIRSHNDHPDFPDALSVIGGMGQDRVGDAGDAVPDDADRPRPGMHYFDSRGVFRVYETDVDATSWRLQRIAPGFSQRFTGTLSADGNTIDGRWQMREDDVHWADDVQITYRREA